MSIKPIDERLDELAGVEKAVAEDKAALGNEIIAEPIEYTTEPVEFEGEKVASLFGAVRGAIKSAPKRTEVPVTQPGATVEKVGPYQVVPNAEPAKAEQILQTAPTMPAAGKPSPTTAQVQAGVQETVFNLDQIKDVDGVKQFIEATARQYGADQLQKISYTEVAAKAADEGYDEKFIARLIDPNVSTQADPASAYKMLLAVTDAGKRAFDLGEKVKAAKAAGTLTDELATEFHQAVALEGVLLKAAKGRQADIARTLGIFSQARTATAQRGAMLQSVLDEAGGLDNAFDLANKYTALDTRGARAGLAEKTIGGTLKDVWFGTWINGLLSSPVTHAKNIAGNTFFNALQIPERAVASVIGKARVAAFGGEEAIAMDEVYSMAAGFLQGIREGGEIALTAFKKNEPTDPFTKIEQARLGKDPFDVSFGDSDLGKSLSSAVRYWGKGITLPGRALMAEDEFFKAIGYRMELNALATREASAEYKRLLASGIDEATATAQAQNRMVAILTDPPADIDEAAKAFSRTTTFTRDLEPSLRGIQKTLQNPLLKIFVPFVRTPTNIALEAMARTPGLNLASPRFWADYNAGGIKRDMAMARVTLGGGLIASTSMAALEGKLTGYGPFRNEDRQALEGTGWQPFSYVFNRSDISDEQLKDFEKITKISVGPDKVYISYAGLEPISTLLSIAGTMGEYSMMESGEADMEKMAMAGALATYTYLGDQPMLQGFGEITKVFTSGAKDAPTFLYNVMAQASKQGTNFLIGGSPVGAYSSLIATVERIMDPARSQINEATTDLDKNPMDGAVKGFWEAVNFYKSRNPMTSSSLPPMLDPLTGDVKKAGKGNLYEAYNPFKKSDGTTSFAHAVLVEYGVPMYRPPRKIDGVELTAQQYNRWIELSTRDGQLASNIETLGRSPQLARLAARDMAAAQDLIRKEISESYSLAKEALINEDRDLKDAINEIKEIEKDVGQYKR